MSIQLCSKTHIDILVTARVLDDENAITPPPHWILRNEWPNAFPTLSKTVQPPAWASQSKTELGRALSVANIKGYWFHHGEPDPFDPYLAYTWTSQPAPLSFVVAACNSYIYNLGYEGDPDLSEWAERTILVLHDAALDRLTPRPNPEDNPFESPESLKAAVTNRERPTREKIANAIDPIIMAKARNLRPNATTPSANDDLATVAGEIYATADKILEAIRDCVQPTVTKPR